MFGLRLDCGLSVQPFFFGVGLDWIFILKYWTGLGVEKISVLSYLVQESKVREQVKDAEISEERKRNETLLLNDIDLKVQ